MKETTFVIHHLENGWGWPDIDCDEVAVEYLCEELEIPEELINEVHCGEGTMQLSLIPDRGYMRDDWYVNLMRCA
ncbi:hypothetical protein WCX49_10815 [Sulfurimonas sp. HSL-1656]|uniref:hypothetical protein n=1 Tax=Thiomicrolovo subterrani TaxID=3131934 RepID=UPI0031F86AC9